MDNPMRSSQISFSPTVQQQENWAVQKSRLQSDGQITELRIHTYPFDDERGQCFDLDNRVEALSGWVAFWKADQSERVIAKVPAPFDAGCIPSCTEQN